MDPFLLVRQAAHTCLEVKVLSPPGKGKDWRKARTFRVTERLEAECRLTLAIPEAAARDRLERVDSTRSLLA
jgi:hypothetical protein